MCPDGLRKVMAASARVVVAETAVFLDPKKKHVLRDVVGEDSVIMVDGCHNLEHLCSDAFSVNLKKSVVDRASESIKSLENIVKDLKKNEKLVELVDEANFSNQIKGDSDCGEYALAQPYFRDEAEPDDAVCGSILRADHFLRFLRKLVKALHDELSLYSSSDGQEPKILPSLALVNKWQSQYFIDIKTMRQIRKRLNAMLIFFELTNKLHDFESLNLVVDFATILGSLYSHFCIVAEPFIEDSMTKNKNPLLQLVCLDPYLEVSNN